MKKIQLFYSYSISIFLISNLHCMENDKLYGLNAFSINNHKNGRILPGNTGEGSYAIFVSNEELGFIEGSWQNIKNKLNKKRLNSLELAMKNEYNIFHIIKTAAKNTININSEEEATVTHNFCKRVSSAKEIKKSNSNDAFILFSDEIISKTKYYYNNDTKTNNDKILCRGIYEAIKLFNKEGEKKHGSLQNLTQTDFINEVTKNLNNWIENGKNKGLFHINDEDNLILGTKGASMRKSLKNTVENRLGSIKLVGRNLYDFLCPNDNETSELNSNYE